MGVSAQRRPGFGGTGGLNAPNVGAAASPEQRMESECYGLYRMAAVRRCSVGFKSATGISHSVDVEAETLYEAAALGLARLKKDGWIEGLGPGTRLQIQVREPGSHHVLSVQQIERWINSVNASPTETLKKATLRQLLKA